MSREKLYQVVGFDLQDGTTFPVASKCLYWPGGTAQGLEQARAMVARKRRSSRLKQDGGERYLVLRPGGGWYALLDGSQYLYLLVEVPPTSL